MRFGEYVRVSTKSQAANATEEKQRLQNAHLVKELGGEIVVAPFEDLGVSGYSVRAEQRKGVLQLIEAVRDKKIDAIVFYDESRLSRQIIDFYTDFLRPIQRIDPDIKFYKSSTMKEWNPRSKEAKHSFIDARKESRNKKAMAKSVQNMIISKERRPGTKLPVGIKAIVNDRLVPDEKLPLVIYIFELASWGHSEREIARRIQKFEVSLKWTHTTIHHILNNPLYIGQQTWNRRKSKKNSAPKEKGEITLLEKTLPPLVDPSLWNLAHDAIRLRKEGKLPRLKTSFLLDSLLFCGGCHTALEQQNSIKGNKAYNKSGDPLLYYYCNNDQCKNYHYRIDAKAIHGKVMRSVSTDLAQEISPGTIESKINQWKRDLRKKIKRAELDREHCIMQQKELMLDDQTFPGDLRQELLERTKDVLDDIGNRTSYLRQLQQDIENLNAPQVLNTILNRAQKLDMLDSSEYRYLLLSAIDRIDVFPEEAADGGVHLNIAYNYFPLRAFSNEISAALEDCPEEA